jgi:hypothetical protein
MRGTACVGSGIRKRLFSSVSFLVGKIGTYVFLHPTGKAIKRVVQQVWGASSWPPHTCAAAPVCQDLGKQTDSEWMLRLLARGLFPSHFFFFFFFFFFQYWGLKSSPAQYCSCSSVRSLVFTILSFLPWKP